jgi:hypothetical protein
VRVLITGWRGAWKGKPGATEEHRPVVEQELYALEEPNDPLIIVHGRCPYGGVDLYAHEWACKNGHQPEPHPANWDTYGRAAGGIRNSEMVALGADLCLAFPGPGSTGTWDCIRKAAGALIRVQIVALRPTNPQDQVRQEPL